MYTSFWNLSPTQAAYIHKYMCSDCYRQATAEEYRESEFWSNLSRNTFAAVNHNVVMLHSGHRFVDPPIREGASVLEKVRNTLLDLMSRTDVLLRLVKRISSVTGASSQKAEYLKMRRKSRKAFKMLDNLQETQGGGWHIPPIMEGVLKYNELMVYDSIENLLLINKFFDMSRHQTTFLEIGAGAGLTSVLLLDHIRGSKIIICDLPITICVGYTLICHFAKDKYRIILPHKATKDVLVKGLFDVAFITPSQTALIEDNSVDGVINVHSMQEMEMGVVKAYFSLIKRVSRKGAIFYCKNREVSRQHPDNRFGDYPWDSIGATIFDGIAEYASRVYGIDHSTVRVKVTKV